MATGMMMTVPNILTLFRLLATLAIGGAFVFLPRPVADILATLFFFFAALTDWFDGYLARRWHQVSALGTMLDPIADKALVLITCICVARYSTLADILVLTPAVLIVFREVFVSGIREHLGQKKSGLQVTTLAKYKTAFQLTALALLLMHGFLEHEFVDRLQGLSQDWIEGILYRQEPDPTGLRHWFYAVYILSWMGVVMLWLAALLTVITGVDYFRKALPQL